MMMRYKKSIFLDISHKGSPQRKLFTKEAKKKENFPLDNRVYLCVFIEIFCYFAPFPFFILVVQGRLHGRMLYNILVKTPHTQ